MRRLLLPALALAILALLLTDRFRRPPGADPPWPRETGLGGSAPATDTPPSEAEDARRRAAVRARLVRDGPGSYLDSLLLTTDSVLRRWPGPLGSPLRVAIVEGGAPEYTPIMAEYVREALATWERAGLGLRFLLATDTASAEIVVRWVERLTVDRTGQTDLTWDQLGRVRRAVILLATRDARGTALRERGLRAVAVHEVGHALGLPHSPDPGDAMFPEPRSGELSERDRRTLVLLYDLPPGSVRESGARPGRDRLPARLPNEFAGLDSVVLAGIRRGVYPGAVIMVGRASGVIYARGYGRLTWSPGSARPDPDSTLYDLASLTKVMATTSAIMLLVDRGRIELDAPVHRYLPRMARDEQAAITVRRLLDHTSGLRPYEDYWRLARGRDSALALLFAELPVRPPGTSAVYSDLNAMLLGLVAEAVAGEDLDRFVAREVFAPLGMTRTGFGPGAGAHCAPTRMENGRPLACRVNDRNADVLGGVSGHAGLFAPASDVARYAEWWLRRGLAPGGRLVTEGTMDRFVRRGPASGSRALGWDTPEAGSNGPSVFGSLASPAAFGHTGWTGTQVWIDPGQDLFVVFLTNRSFEPRVSRSITRLRSIRAEVADAASAGARRLCLATRPTPPAC